jgi:hypothetical protein
MTDLEMRETLAHIDLMRVETQHKIEDIQRIIAEHDQRRREWRWYPFVVVVPMVISAFAAGGGAIVAGIALAKWL